MGGLNNMHTDFFEVWTVFGGVSPDKSKNNTWHVASRGRQSVICISADQISGMTDEEIGEAVRGNIGHDDILSIISDVYAGNFRIRQSFDDEEYLLECRLQTLHELLSGDHGEAINKILRERLGEIDNLLNPEGRYHSEAKQPQKASEPKKHQGYIYLIHGTGTQWYKIGLTTDLDKRIKAFNTQGPFTHETVCLHHVSDMYGAESFWHSHFADKRAQGEWFTLTDGDVGIFTSAQWVDDGWEL